MRKLKLQLDDLHVDTFHTTAADGGRGTVFAEQCTCYTVCTCPGCATCEASCNGTCDGSCAATGCGCEASHRGGACLSEYDCPQEW